MRANNHRPHKLDYIPLIVGDKPDTATAPKRPRFGKYHHRGNSCRQCIPILVRCRWSHFILEKKGILQNSTSCKKEKRRATKETWDTWSIPDGRFSVYMEEHRWLKTRRRFQEFFRLQTFTTLRLSVSRNFASFFSALLITLVIFTSSNAPTTVPQATHWIRQNFCPVFVVTGTASNSWYSHVGHFDLAISVPSERVYRTYPLMIMLKPHLFKELFVIFPAAPGIKFWNSTMPSKALWPYLSNILIHFYSSRAVLRTLDKPIKNL